MTIMSDKKVFRQSSITTLRQTDPSELSRKFTNMQPKYTMQRKIVPTQVAQASDGETRTMNSSGRPTR